MKVPSSAPILTWFDLLHSCQRKRWSDLAGSNQVRFTFSGRGAIYRVLRSLSAGSDPSRNLVLIPAYHCPTVVDPALHAGCKVGFYHIAKDLSIVSDDLLRKLDDRVLAVVFIDYFGMAEPDQRLRDAVKAAGAAIIDDRSHSFLKVDPVRLAHLNDADATIFSFWKLIPCLIGGGLVSANSIIQSECKETSVPLQTHREYISRAMRQLLQKPLDRLTAAKRMLTAQDCDPNPAALPVIVKPANEAYPYNHEAADWPMPSFSKRVLINSDLECVAARRRENYCRLLSLVSFRSGFEPAVGSLPEQACPWGFPVRVYQRSRRDYRLRASGVPVFSFGEVLHPQLWKDGSSYEMRKDAEYLSKSLLVLSIHQGISLEQVEDIGARTNRFLLT